MPTATDTALTASELRVVLGQLMRRLRAEHRFPLVPRRRSSAGWIARARRASASSPRPSGCAPSRWPRRVGELEARRPRHPPPRPDDGRRALVELTDEGREALEEDRRRRVGWLVEAIETLPKRDQEILARAVPIIARLAESDPAA